MSKHCWGTRERIKKGGFSKVNLCRAYDLGVVEYDKALQLQSNLISARLAGEIPDIILLLQHPSVFTIGVSGSEKDIVASRALLDKEAIPIFHVDRGGSTTYHGPGQMVGYLIFDLRTKERDICQYMRNLEEVIIRNLRAFFIEACRDSKFPGVWVGREKICAMGIQVTRWVTKHGFALNVNTDLEYFSYIIPCGIPDRKVTSMAQQLGHETALGDVVSRTLEHCAHVFNIDVIQESKEQLDSYYVQ